MSNFTAYVATVNGTVNIEFDTIQEYSRFYDAIANSVLSVEFGLNADDSNLDDNEYQFFSLFDEPEYHLIWDFEQGKYNDIFVESSSDRAAFYFLVDNKSTDPNDALDRYQNVQMFHGTPEEFADDYLEEFLPSGSWLLKYFDVDDFLSDLFVDGSIVDLSDDGYVVTNATEF